MLFSKNNVLILLKLKIYLSRGHPILSSHRGLQPWHHYYTERQSLSLALYLLFIQSLPPGSFNFPFAHPAVHKAQGARLFSYPPFHLITPLPSLCVISLFLSSPAKSCLHVMILWSKDTSDAHWSPSRKAGWPRPGRGQSLIQTALSPFMSQGLWAQGVCTVPSRSISRTFPGQLGRGVSCYPLTYHLDPWILVSLPWRSNSSWTVHFYLKPEICFAFTVI